MLKKTLRLTLPAIAAAALLTGCTTSESPESTSSGSAHSESAHADQGGTEEASHNDADVTFAQEMIPHHRQAVVMAELVPERTENARVRELADDIERAQSPEIEQLSEWLDQWGAPVPGEHEGHGSGHGDMPGMMSDGRLEQLSELRDAEFDKRWLELMIEHHAGAIEMARTELAQGSDKGALELAQQVIDAQQGEIDVMESLLGTS
ncbi:DUF305 domain-containing protein [Prauserella cavernicola]|uniref:DUF305 domain-containing protein n=1 Tax=Prauserella cavernicola TaxID=2800127 RepID=A0A934V3F0_9PSEU|nr:DUF305 domain-containing protein [Prauserella cavernicola]MBK1784272.1 DUF305 domain-containing protein [Prauserella cavernicola]